MSDPTTPVEVLSRFAADMARGVGVCEKPHRNGEAHPHVHYDDRYIAKARQLSCRRGRAVPVGVGNGMTSPDEKTLAVGYCARANG